MKLGLHAYSYVLAGGLRDYRPVGRGVLSASELLERAAQLKCAAVQLARRNITDAAEMDLVTLVRLRAQAEELGLTLHLSTGVLEGEHLADMIRAANSLGAPQVTVSLAHLRGNVQQRQQTLEGLLLSLDVAFKTAERYKVTLAFENGCHTAAMDLEAFVQAAQSDWVGVCFDAGNPLTVPEHPVESALRLAPYCTSIHLKDWQVYRTADGAALVNCPLGDGVLEIDDILRVFSQHKPGVLVFLQTAAERVTVPVLNDEFLLQYPRISARALAGLLRRGELNFPADKQRFPHEKKALESEILDWEDARVQRSIKEAQRALGTGNLELPFGDIPSVPTPPRKAKGKGKRPQLTLAGDDLA